MCIEDLRLGRKRIAITHGQDLNSAQSVTFGANGRRVAAIFSFSGTDFCQISVDQAQTFNVIAYLANGQNTVMLDIERHGNLLERAFVISNASASLQKIAFTEILTDDT